DQVDAGEEDVLRASTADAELLANLRENLLIILVQIINSLSRKTLGWKHQSVGVLSQKGEFLLGGTGRRKPKILQPLGEFLGHGEVEIAVDESCPQLLIILDGRNGLPGMFLCTVTIGRGRLIDHQLFPGLHFGAAGRTEAGFQWECRVTICAVHGDLYWVGW